MILRIILAIAVAIICTEAAITAYHDVQAARWNEVVERSKQIDGRI